MASGTEDKRGEKPPRKLWALLIALSALGLAAPLLLRAFVVEAFQIPASSMYPSLLIGDHVFISKWGYGCERCAPERGAAFVFLYPGSTADEPYDYVKRVIALPGDELLVDHGVPVINGWRAPRCSLGRARVAEHDGSARDYEFFVEFLAGRAYLVVHEGDLDDGVQGPYRVGPNEAWVLGDNRMNSADSRSWSEGKGAGVPFENFHGAVRALWLPVERVGAFGEGPPALPQSAAALAPQLTRCLAAAPSRADSTPPPR